MANLNISTSSGNAVTVKVSPVASQIVQVTTVPNQIVQINRGVSGPSGPAGPNDIGGYPINVTSPQNLDALMFQSNAWVNIPQTEISDGGNF
jgi:hypothetical protein